MSQDFYNCNNCGEIFGDYSPHKACMCDNWFCKNCMDDVKGIDDDKNRADFKSCKFCREQDNQTTENEDIGKISDGYHTFDELYFHRMVLFSIICNQNKEKAWRSKLHHDGTMFDNYFIVGIETPDGQYSYHYNLECWQYFDDIKTLEKAPAWDGHKPEDITRLFSILKTELYPLTGPQCVNCDMFQNKTCVRKSIKKDNTFVCWMEEEY